MALAAPRSLNLGSAFSDVKASLAAGGTADIVILGDSLSFRPGTYLPYFRNLMQQRYGNAGYGYQGYSLFTGAGLNMGWTSGGVNTDLPPYHSLDGLWNAYDGSTGFPNQGVFYPLDRQVQLQYLTRPGGGSFELRKGIDGDLITTINTGTSTSGIGTYNYTLSPGDTEYTIRPLANGPFTILGQNNTRPQPGVRIHRAANGGWGVNNFLRRESSFDQQLNLLGTDMVMVWLGQNDQGETRNSYRQKIGALVDRLEAAAPDAEIVLIGTYDQGAPPLAWLVEGMFDVANSRGLGFINLFSAAGNSSFFNLNGYLDDGVHFSAAGGQYMGNLLFNAFVTNGGSLAAQKGPLNSLVPGINDLSNPLTGTSAGPFRVIPEPATALSAGIAAAWCFSFRRRR